MFRAILRWIATPAQVRQNAEPIRSFWMTAPCTRVALTTAFLRIGMVAFGGLGPAMTLMQRDLVERRQWASAGDLSEALAFTKPLPGSTVVQVTVTMQRKGWCQ